MDVWSGYWPARDAPTTVRERRCSMRGTMLWFNEEKDVGYMLTDEGERLAVTGGSFADGMKPKGRCARAVVSFKVTESGGVRVASEVALITEASPRRARRRHRASSS